jgi:hypothetical protein
MVQSPKRDNRWVYVHGVHVCGAGPNRGGNIVARTRADDQHSFGWLGKRAECIIVMWERVLAHARQG